jgi:nucleoid-associated protein YgaU
MNKYFLGLMALAAVAGGCSSSNKDAKSTALRPAVIDIAPSAPAAYASPVQPIAPVAVAQPVEPAPVAYSPAAAPAVGGSTYTVQKGDSLYKIARERYGDPKQWQKIAAANPGINPNSLKVGQTLTMP